jgi:archaellum component FlaC
MKNDENIVSYPNSIETRVALLEMSVSNINQTLIRIEAKMDKGFDDINKRFDSIDKRFGDVDKKFEGIDKKFDDFRKDMRSDFRWILTIIAGLSAVMAHGFHWF